MQVFYVWTPDDIIDHNYEYFSWSTENYQGSVNCWRHALSEQAQPLRPVLQLEEHTVWSVRA